ncbi:inner membrane magnesium transporter mrs2 protein [Apiospora arundinis]
MTPIDNAMKSKNAFLGFAGLIAAASVYMIWGSDLLPAEGDPKGNPETWTRKSCEGARSPSAVERYDGTATGESQGKHETHAVSCLGRQGGT